MSRFSAEKPARLTLRGIRLVYGWRLFIPSARHRMPFALDRPRWRAQCFSARYVALHSPLRILFGSRLPCQAEDGSLWVVHADARFTSFHLKRSVPYASQFSYIRWSQGDATYGEMALPPP